MNEKERACIAQSHEAQLASARRRLADFSLRTSFESPLKGFTGGITWEENHRDRMKQIAVLPLACLVALFLAAMTPVLYIAHRFDLLQRRRAIIKEIRTLEEEGPSMDVPDKKALEHLWAFHGLHGAGHDVDEKIELLNSWVITLYGQAVADAHGVKAQFDEIAMKQLEANRGYYEGRVDTHVHVVPSFDMLLSKVSKALPAY